MATLNCYIDPIIMEILEKFSKESGRTVEDLAECAISEYVIECEKRNKP